MVSGIFNASNLVMYSGNPGFTTCWLDTIVPTNLSTQFVIGHFNTDQVYIGDGTRNKSVWIGRGSVFNNDIRIGNESSTISVGNTLNVTGSLRIPNNGGGSTHRLYLSGTNNYHSIYSSGEGGDYTNFCEYSGWNFRCTNPNVEGTIVASISETGVISTEGDIKVKRSKGIIFSNSVTNVNTLNSYIVDDGHLNICTDNNMYFKTGCTNVGGVNYGTEMMRIEPEGITVSTKLTVDGSVVNSGTNILNVKQNTGNYLTQTDGTRDPFAISSLNGGSGYLTMGMGVDTTYNAAYINCAMANANRPLILAPRFGDVYIGPVPATFNKTDNRNAGSNLYLNASLKFQNNGSGISWYDQAGGVNLYSRIFDDGNLQFCTDDDMFFFTGSTVSTKGTCSMTLKTTFIGMGKPLYVNNRMYIGGTNIGTADSSTINSYTYAVLNIETPNNPLRDGIAIKSTGGNDGAYMIFINSTGGICGWIQMTGGNNVNYLESSDRRLKNNIRPLDSMLDKIMGLKPSVYNWISAPDFESDGFIAQEVFELFSSIKK